MASAASFRRNLRTFTGGNLSPVARSARLAHTARDALADLQGTGRVSGSYRVTTVDGRKGASEDTVRGDGRGVVLYEFSYTAEAATFALAFLRRRAAGASGYSRSFFVGVNGKFIRAADFNPASVPFDAEIVIGNTEPYNRIADTHTAGTKVIRFPVPTDLYGDAARATARRFGNAATAKRVHDITFPGKYRLQQAQHRKTGKRAGRVVRAAGEFVESPALIITPRI